MTPLNLLQNCRLFISKIILLLPLLEPLVHNAYGEVIVRNDKNETVLLILDVALPSSSPLPHEGLFGRLVNADPEDACTPIQPPPSQPANETWIALIRRYPCTFPTKINNALRAGFQGVIVYSADKPVNNGSFNHNASHLLAFASDGIPAVLVSKDDGSKLKNHFLYDKNYFILIMAQFEPNILSYLVPVASVIGIALIAMIVVMISKCLRDERRSRRNRLSSKHLKKLTVTKYHKGDHYDVCAICLEDYVDGEKVRELPCGHIYHFKCIDPWLTNNRRVCPVCKSKVLLPGLADISSDSDDNSHANVRTPLIEPQRNRERGREPRNRNIEQFLENIRTSNAQRRSAGYRSLDDSAIPTDRRAFGEGGSGISQSSDVTSSSHSRRHNRSHRNHRNRRSRTEPNQRSASNTEEASTQGASEERPLIIQVTEPLSGDTPHDVNSNSSYNQAVAALVEAIVEIDLPNPPDQSNTIDV